MTGENYKPPMPGPSTKEHHLRKLSAWWDEQHQHGGLPHACMTMIPEMPHATRGAIRARMNGFKWWQPDILLAIPRGGYGSLWIRFRIRMSKNVVWPEETAFDDDLRVGGNCVCIAGSWKEAVSQISDYVAGKIVRED